MLNWFVFISTPIDFQGDTPIEVIRGHFFQKANSKQIEVIKEGIRQVHPHEMSMYWPYEMDPQHKAGNADPAARLTLTPEAAWRYWIIEFGQDDAEIENLQHAALLLERELEFGFTVVGTTPMWTTPGQGDDVYGAISWNPAPLVSYFIDQLGASDKMVQLATKDLTQLASNYQSIVNLTNEHQAVRRALSLFDSLRSLPRRSEMSVLGYFSVIECLVTHLPDPKDPSDALTRQVKAKIPLLRKRFDRKLDYSSYFDNAAEDKLWAKLYEYRSRIAHGADTEIDSSLSILRSKDNIAKFLHEVIKLLLLVAINDPVLVTDLKKC